MVDKVNLFHNEDGQWEVELFDRGKRISLENISVNLSARGKMNVQPQLEITIKGNIKR